MRKRTYVIGLSLALAGSLAMASAAQAIVTGQTLTVSVGGTKQDKKVPGPASLDVNIATSITPPTPAAQTAAQTDLDFDRDFRFFPGRLQDCSPAQLANTTTAAAIAACGRAQVGTGDATLCSAAGGCAALTIPAVVTAFNGTPSGGSPTILLHVKAGGIAAAVPNLVLVGTLINSPAGGEFGKRLSVQVPDTSSQGVHITNFHTAVPKQRTQTPTKKQKKKCKTKPKKAKKNCLNKKKKFYVMARCSDRNWEFRETTNFRAGGGTQIANTNESCVKRGAKKKKK
ncbi:MAG: hypothetical protein ACRDL6_02635 [Solirubrobacterales bacterium]